MQITRKSNRLFLVPRPMPYQKINEHLSTTFLSNLINCADKQTNKPAGVKAFTPWWSNKCAWRVVLEINEWYGMLSIEQQEEIFYTHTWQKCPPHLNNVLTLPSENENITFHTFIMHFLNITRCIKLNDRPDGIIHRIEVWSLWSWWVRWPRLAL